MQADLVRSLFEYNHWARQRVLLSSSKLSAEDFIKPMGGSFSSVRDTLAHIFAAEWIWFERWNGRSPKSLTEGSTFPTISSLRASWDELDGARSSFLAALDDARLAAELAYINTRGQPFSYPLGQQLLHVVNHSTYHRGQVITLLRQLKAEVLSTDLLLYYDEQKLPVSSS